MPNRNSIFTFFRGDGCHHQLRVKVPLRFLDRVLSLNLVNWLRPIFWVDLVLTDEPIYVPDLYGVILAAAQQNAFLCRVPIKAHGWLCVSYELVDRPVGLLYIPNADPLVFLARGHLKCIMGVVFDALYPLLCVIIVLLPCDLQHTGGLIDIKNFDLTVIATWDELFRLSRVPVQISFCARMLIVTMKCGIGLHIVNINLLIPRRVNYMLGCLLVPLNFRSCPLHAFFSIP